MRRLAPVFAFFLSVHAICACASGDSSGDVISGEDGAKLAEPKDIGPEPESKPQPPPPPPVNGCIVYGSGPQSFLPTAVGQSSFHEVKLTGCGTIPSLLLDVAVEGDGSFTAVLEEPAWVPGGAPLQVMPLQQLKLRVTFAPTAESAVENGLYVPASAKLRLTYREDSEAGEASPPAFLEILVQGIGLLPCIHALMGVEALPGDGLGIRLLGSSTLSAGGQVTGYQWAVEGPAGATLLYHPSPNVADIVFATDLAGDYTAWLTVTDSAGTPQCEGDPVAFTLAGPPASVELPEPEGEGLFVALTWRTPGDWDDEGDDEVDGADLDLHLAHPWAGGPDLDEDGLPDGWFDTPYDCWQGNASPNWGISEPDSKDDPMHEGISVGGGPETIFLPGPEAVDYRVGVHSMENHGYGPSFARTRVYVDGELRLDTGEVLLTESDLWEVCRFDGETGIVVPVVDEAGAPKILPDYDNPYAP